MDVPQEVLAMDTKGIQLHLTWGLCIPDSCQHNDVKGLLSTEALKTIAPFLGSVSVHCSEEKSVSDDPSAITAIAILAIFGSIMLIGTALEFILSKRSKWHKSWSLDKFSKVQNNSKQHNEIDTTSGNKDMSAGTVESCKTDKLDNKENVLPENYVPHAEHGMNGSCKDMCSELDMKKYYQKEVVPESEKNACKRNDGVLIRFLTAFAIQVNTKKIVSVKAGQNAINCIHGVRFLSITWVLLGHSLNYGLFSLPGVWTTANPVRVPEMLETFTYQAVLSIPLAVDSFFMISGMLVAYSQINSASRLMDNFSCSKTAAFAGKYIFHRFWRLTPLYMIVIMVLTCLMNYFGDGPFWPSALPLADNCRTNWWTNLLYINNFLPAVNQCMSWSWFLSDDMQFYVMTLFVLIFLAVSMKIGLVLISVLMIGGMSAAAYSEHTYKGDLLHGKEDNDVYWTNVYTPPWCRVSAYCVGLLLGIIMKKRPRKQLNWIQAVIGWTLATAGGLFVVYIPYTYYRKGGTPWSIDVKSAYESLARPLWASCVAWVVFACHNGNGGVVNKILSWRGLVPLSRLSYAVYLIHPIVMMTHFYSRRTLFYISDFNVVYLYIGHTVVSFMVAFVASLAFESSFLSLEKIIMGR
ncbi:nose resistant to fluoxetine protein 6-like isoform X3 [Mytilus galloprovincialis]|uniref:nose resistant to fluoxetine protein 6-like isoform X3 n=1 Tax=Mytilus galloprovincialis TaxID=29158 RepID=UPI003F7B88F6